MGSVRHGRAHVVGGGIGGLTAALALAMQGASVCVSEQADGFTEVGAGVQITPNAMRVLDALGVGPAVTRSGIVSDAVVPYDGLSGRAVTRFDLRAQDPRYVFVHRARLIDVLVMACRARGVTLQTGVRVTQADADADLTVFADGIHSVGRGLVDRPGKAVFTGQVAWRAIVPGAMPPEARICMAPGRHLVCYPLGPDQINLVAVEERSDWAQEGWHHADDPANLRAAFADSAPWIRDLLGKVDVVNLWGLFRHDVAGTWVNGNMALLGDAAHPTLPFLAQGANLAIEDAFVLAQCWGAGRLHDYAPQRRPRVQRAIAAADANAVNYHLRGLRRTASLAALRGIGALAPNAFLSRLSWLYDHDLTS